MLFAVAALLACAAAQAAPALSQVDIPFKGGGPLNEVPPSLVRMLIGLSLLSFIPFALIAMTSFTRIVVTLSFLRQALGMQETPPNMVLITLAAFMTFFTMAPTLEASYRSGLGPYLEGRLSTSQAAELGMAPIRKFMSAHVRPEELLSVSELAKADPPGAEGEVPLRVLVPAFMLSELRAAFTAGFIIFLPFLLIDLVVASVLMALGMMMVPPVSISLPLKLLLFVLIDGWSLIIRSIAGAYS